MNKVLGGFVLSLSLYSPCFALQTYPLVDQEKTAIQISKKDQNRLAVSKDRIRQIFGSEGGFDIQTDEEGGQVFLKLLAPESDQAFSITIMTESGLTQDLRLIPKNIESQSILFIPEGPDPSRGPASHQEEMSETDQVIHLMNVMISGKGEEAYKVQALTTSNRPRYQEIAIKPLSIFRSPHFEGTMFELKNEGRGPLLLREDQWWLEEDCAIHLSERMLDPGQTATLCVVSQPRRDSSRRAS